MDFPQLPLASIFMEVFFVLIINSAQIWCMVHDCFPCSSTIMNSMLRRLHPNALRFEWWVLTEKKLELTACMFFVIHTWYFSEFMNSSLFPSCPNFI